ncbi:hypothetical protein ACSBOB_18640 [Mesorhizobium sp. ASY16-5R]|uniref:hypothetical protein n=1 Tax=Mesorhizobium sp. ASY16-5R TaxID=3445772 RepID=UPI003FA000F9
MPGVIAIIPTLLINAVTAVTAPVGAYTVTSIGMMRRYDWPIAATSRKDLFDRLFAGSECLPSMCKGRAMMERLAEMDFDDFKVDAATLDAVKSNVEFPLAGNCLESIIGVDAEAFVIDPTAPVRVGDVCVYAVAGGPARLVKVFVGCRAGLAFFWCSHPETLLVHPIANVLHVDRVLTIIDRDGTRWSPEPVIFEAFPPGEEWATVPKDGSIEIAAGKALAMIYEAARSLPDDAPRRISFNDTIRELSRDGHPARFIPNWLSDIRAGSRRTAPPNLCAVAE